MTPVERETLKTTLDPIVAAALTVYGEARNQPVMGMVGVLSVIRNRVTIVTPRWSPTWPSVCLARKQFSCWNDHDPNQATLLAFAKVLTEGESVGYNPLLDVCLYLADRAVKGDLKDNTGRATHYYNPAVVTPDWAGPPAVRTVVLGAHAFYKNVAL